MAAFVNPIPTEAIKYEGRKIVVMQTSKGPQGFYRSMSVDKSGQRSWKPFDGIGYAAKFEKERFTKGKNEHHELFEFGSVENKLIAQELNKMDLQRRIPAAHAQQINPLAVNIFLNTAASLEQNRKLRQIGNRDEPTPGIRPSRDSYQQDSKRPHSSKSRGEPGHFQPPKFAVQYTAADGQKFPVVVVRNMVGQPQAFYRSSGQENGMPGRWLPFDGIQPTRDGPTFDLRRFTTPAAKADGLNRFGSPMNEAISKKLGEMDRAGLAPKPIEVNRAGVNRFIGTPEAQRYNEEFKVLGNHEKSTLGVRPSPDVYANWRGSVATRADKMVHGAHRLVDKLHQKVHSHGAHRTSGQARHA